MSIKLSDIETAREVIPDDCQYTRLISSSSLTQHSNCPVYLKLENQQSIGSFKIRGAIHAVSKLSDIQRSKGIVCVSSGNHGRGLAYASSTVGAHCIVCMSSLVPQNKIDAIKALGAEVRIIGKSQDEAQITVDRLVASEGLTYLSPFDQSDVISGQGTIGLELAEQVENLQSVLVPVSGGGLIAGIAIALKAINSKIQVIGVSMEHGAAMYESIKAGKPIEVEELPSLADALGGGIGLDNHFTFEAVQTLVDELILVSEKEISQAIRHAYWEDRQIIEGAGAVAIAALLSRKFVPTGPTVALVSGGNIDMRLHHRITCGEDVDLSRC
ncbi:MAG: hydroxyectoine utilization dehydratase EutB [Acidiferrobacterales bacterium]|nr:hydroxyectoine utilization dehydratase EutB [Acidiferrobacterales bacterium]